MTYSLLIPALVAVALVAIAFAGAGNLLPPRVRASFLSVLTVLAATSVMAALGSVVAASLAAESPLGALVAWCTSGATSHVAAPPGAGFVAAGLLLVGSTRAGALIAREHRAARMWRTQREVEVVDVAEVIAFASPRDDSIVVSSGALAVLDGPERRAVFAHERAHLELGHHRHLWATEMSVAFVPPLAPLAWAARRAVERAADEAAAERVGDRRLVARALTRLALQSHQRGPATRPHLRTGRVEHRVRSLLAAPPGPLTRRAAMLSALLLVAAAAAGATQAHHLGEVLAHLCW